MISKIYQHGKHDVFINILNHAKNPGNQKKHSQFLPVNSKIRFMFGNQGKIPLAKKKLPALFLGPYQTPAVRLWSFWTTWGLIENGHGHDIPKRPQQEFLAFLARCTNPEIREAWKVSKQTAVLEVSHSSGTARKVLEREISHKNFEFSFDFFITREFYDSERVGYEKYSSLGVDWFNSAKPFPPSFEID